MPWVAEMEAEPGLEPRSPDSSSWTHSILHPVFILKPGQGHSIWVTIIWLSLPHRSVDINAGAVLHLSSRPAWVKTGWARDDAGSL